MSSDSEATWTRIELQWLQDMLRHAFNAPPASHVPLNFLPMKHLKVRHKLQTYILLRSFFLGYSCMVYLKDQKQVRTHQSSIYTPHSLSFPSTYFEMVFVITCHHLRQQYSTAATGNLYRESAEPGQRKTNPRSEQLDNSLTMLWKWGSGSLHIRAPVDIHLPVSQALGFARQLVLKAGSHRAKHRDVTPHNACLHSSVFPWIHCRWLQAGVNFQSLSV